ncbi:metallophosphoesterase [Leisingera sp. XS_AS12]|uniref:metallophosphoesterase n=1 Tax=Leisingera sp. XS_AS12 TaxID=3241294 RepID=UPI003512C61D
MAKFLQWSDLHREFGSAEAPVPFPMPTETCPACSVDAILIAGDLDRASSHVASLVEIHQAWQVPVVSIFGNHEPYGSSQEETVSCVSEDLAVARAAGHDIHVLDRDELIIGDTRILGATLWTDFDILGNREAQMLGAEYLINDYRKVRRAPGSDDKQRAEDTVAFHHRDRSWLLDALARPFQGKTLVMTHHLPVPEVLAQRADKGPYAPAYVSDMRADILGLQIDMWVSGHTHWARRGLIEGLHGPIAFSANMGGYVRSGQRQATNFEPYRLIDMDAPELGLDEIGIEEPILAALPGAAEILASLRERDLQPD